MKNQKPKSECRGKLKKKDGKRCQKTYPSCSFKELKKRFAEIDCGELNYESLLLYSTLFFAFKEKKIPAKTRIIMEEWVCKLLHSQKGKCVVKVKRSEVKSFLKNWKKESCVSILIKKPIKKQCREWKLISLVIKNLPEKIRKEERQMLYFCHQLLLIWRQKIAYY